MLGGQLEDERGAPLSHWLLSAIPDEQPRTIACARSDAEGRFAFRDLRAGSYLLQVHGEGQTIGMPLYFLEHVSAGAPELTIHFPDARRPTAYFKGTIETPEGDPPGTYATQVLVSWPQTSPHVAHADADTGEFLVGPLPAGTFEVKVWSKDFPQLELGERTVAPNEVVDLGVVRLQR
jgi:hypothetical protein